jgi:hypothetical protein
MEKIMDNQIIFLIYNCMRFIKTFEGLIKESIKSDLKDFCEINLAYLLDEDFKVMLTRRDSLPSVSPAHKPGYLIHFYRWIGDRTSFWKFSEVQDHFIPFLQRLSNQYEVIECVVDYFKVGKSSTSFSVEQVVSGSIVPDVLISRILIIVKEE